MYTVRACSILERVSSHWHAVVRTALWIGVPDVVLIHVYTAHPVPGCLFKGKQTVQG